MFIKLTLSSEKVTDKTPIPPPDWEALIAQIADDIMAEHTPARILQVRAKLYDLLSHCIPPTTVLKVIQAQSCLRTPLSDQEQTLTFKLIPKIDDALKADVIKWSAFYEHRIRLGSVSATGPPVSTTGTNQNRNTSFILKPLLLSS